MGWIAWQLSESASFVGFVSFLNFAPALVTGPFFGVLIDRVRVKQAAFVTQSLLSVLTALLFLSYYSGLLTQLVLIVLSALFGVVASAHNPVRMSLAPRLVERSAIGSVISIVATAFQLARLSGPAIGGWIIATWGISVCLIVQVFCYLPILITIPQLQPRSRDVGPATIEPFLKALRTGINYVSKDRLIMWALLVTGLVAFVLRGLLEVLPVIADGVFDKGAAGLGLLLSSAGFGALVAGITKTVLPVQTGERLPRLALGTGLVGLCLVPLVGLSPWWGLTVALITVLGFSATMSGVSMQTAVQLGLPDDLRGRVMSIWTMTAMGSSAAGAIFIGASSDLIGFTNTLSIVGGAVFLILAIVVKRVW